MMCGRIEIPDWELIPKLVLLVFRRMAPVFTLPSLAEDPNSMTECLISIWRLRKIYTVEKAKMTLHDLIMESHAFKASDPRDKVYSIIGLADDRDKIRLKIDYSRPIRDLYINVASYMIEHDTDLSLLLSNLHTKSIDLPSWVPDWSTWHFGSNGAAMSIGYDASGNSKPKVRVRRSQNELELSGCIVDSIIRLGSDIGPHYVGTRNPEVNQRRDSWLKEQKEMVREAKRVKRSPHRESASELLWRTLIGNITLDEEKASDDYETLYDAHLQLSNKYISLEDKAMAREFCDAVRRRSRYRRLATTEKAYFGGVPHTSQVGDWICMFHGSSLLHVIREHGRGYLYIGHAYVHGLMNGEILKHRYYKKQTIRLV
jgi:hypothetical protein